MDSDKILYYAGSADEIIEELEKLKPGIQGRINATPDNVESGLAKLVLTLIELIRKLIEKQAMRRIDGNSLSESQIEELGETLMKLEKYFCRYGLHKIAQRTEIKVEIFVSKVEDTF